jgi:hypothetical protein
MAKNRYSDVPMEVLVTNERAPKGGLKVKRADYPISLICQITGESDRSVLESFGPATRLLP